jgi:glycine/D-amino acid oxidase-like deaminating enzyme
VPRIRLRHEVLAAAWDHLHRRWRVSTNRVELTCDVLITATGPLSEPRIPNVPGLETGFLTLFQRTAAWVLARGERRIRDVEQRLYRATPSLHRLVRAAIYCDREALVPGFAINPRLLAIAKTTARSHLRR